MAFRSILLDSDNTLYSTSGPVPIVVTYPAGVQDGDILYMIIQLRYEGASLFPLPPSGWTNVTGISSGRSRFQIWSKAASSEPSTVNVPMRLGSNGYYSWGMVAYDEPLSTASNAGTAGPVTVNDAGSTTLDLSAVGNVIANQRIFYVVSNNWSGVPGNPDYTVPVDLDDPTQASLTLRGSQFEVGGLFMDPDQVHEFWVYDELHVPATDYPARSFSDLHPSTTSGGGSAESKVSVARSAAEESGGVVPLDLMFRAPKLHMRSTQLPHDVHRNQLRKGDRV